MTSALIVEDEPLLAEQLRGKLAMLWPELAIAGVAGEGQEALRLRDRPETLRSSQTYGHLCKLM